MGKELSAVDLHMEPKELVLDLVTVRYPHPCSIRELLQAARIFDITDNSLRVTVTRLVAQGALSSQQRGLYVPGSALREWMQEIRTWRSAAQRMCAWEGNYLLATAGEEKIRGDRQQVRIRERVFDLLGFRTLTPGLMIRPANLLESPAAMLQRMRSLGVSEEMLLFVVQEIAAIDVQQLQQLWPLAELNQSYAALTRQLRGWLASAGTLSLPQAARECFLMGRQAIRHINRDPMLPDAWIDAALRREFFHSANEYDSYGQQVWKRLFSWAETC